MKSSLSFTHVFFTFVIVGRSLQTIHDLYKKRGVLL